MAAERRRLGVSLAYRLYRLARLVAPRRWVTHAVLDAAWITRQLAWDSLWSTLPPTDALRRTRPAVAAFLQEAIPPGARVIDLGGGTGVVTRLVAERAATVLYVDHSAENEAVARAGCAGLANVSFERGDGLDVLQRRGPFDVALMLHVLGFDADPVAALTIVRRYARRLVVEVPDIDADPLNAVRKEWGRPYRHDALYLVEFSREHLRACLESAGWHVSAIEARSGEILALATAAPT